MRSSSPAAGTTPSSIACSSGTEAARLERWLTSVWYGNGAGGWLLVPLAWVFGLLSGLRRLAFRRGWLRAERVGCPVIVVGNLTVGGTGKTPLVVWLATALRDAGHAVAVVSRGHGRAGEGVLEVQPESAAAAVGDEPLLLARRTGLPVIVGRNRVAAARLAVARGAKVVIADDGLQHLRLARDLEIVVVDGRRGFGNGRLLPAGPLREAPRRLHEVDAVVVNASTDPADPSHAAVGAGRVPRYTMRLRPERLEPLDATAARLPLEQFRASRVHAVAGIGNPQRFFALLRAAGLVPIEHPFADHHAFSAADLEFGDALPIVMTEKDAVKCARLGIGPAWYLPVSATLEEGAALLAGILGKLARAGKDGDSTLDTRLLDILACPVCKGPLAHRREAAVLVCRIDRLAYPIRDDVPVMLEEEARHLQADDPLLER